MTRLSTSNCPIRSISFLLNASLEISDATHRISLFGMAKKKNTLAINEMLIGHLFINIQLINPG